MSPPTARRRAEGQELLYEAVCIIVGKYHERTPAAVEAREALLAPIRKQNDAIGQYIRSRRSIDDVNPDTGEEELDTGEGDAKPKVEAKKSGGEAKADGKTGDGKKTEAAKAGDGKKPDAKAAGGKAEEAPKDAGGKTEPTDAEP